MDAVDHVLQVSETLTSGRDSDDGQHKGCEKQLLVLQRLQFSYASQALRD